MPVFSTLGIFRNSCHSSISIARSEIAIYELTTEDTAPEKRCDAERYIVIDPIGITFASTFRIR